MKVLLVGLGCIPTLVGACVVRMPPADGRVWLAAWQGGSLYTVLPPERQPAGGYYLTGAKEFEVVLLRKHGYAVQAAKEEMPLNPDA